jgi:hypothetical protein
MGFEFMGGCATCPKPVRGAILLIPIGHGAVPIGAKQVFGRDRPLFQTDPFFTALIIAAADSLPNLLWTRLM